MERNNDDMFGTAGDQGTGTGGSSAYGSTSAGMAGNESPPGGLDYGTAGTTGTTGVGSTGMGTAGTGQTADKLGKVKERAKELQSTLADRLDAGAEKLRQRNPSAHLAGATGTTGVADVGVASNERMTQMQDSVARGMHKSADWLRNGDLRGDIEKQVRENPGRTLLIALGVGYVLGKAFRNNR
jgi:hypothetical protein